MGEEKITTKNDKNAEERKRIALEVMRGNLEPQRVLAEQGIKKNTLTTWVRNVIKEIKERDEDGHAEARFLGDIYYYGRGVPQNKSKAREQYGYAAKDGDIIATIMIARILFEGKHFNDSLDILKNIVNEDVPEKTDAIQEIYRMGKELLESGFYEATPQRYKKIIERLDFAANHDYTEAWEKLKTLSLPKKEYAPKEVDIPEDDDLPNDDISREQLEILAKTYENPEAMYQFGLIYFQGNDVRRSYKTAVEWMEKSFALGITKAKVYLGFMYADGDDDLQKDYDRARECYEEVADKESTAAFNLGLMYINGQGVAQSYDNAKDKFVQAAENNNADAMVELARMYYEGWGVLKDAAQYKEWLKKAANAPKPNAEAAYNVGLMYMEGTYGEKIDYKVAGRYLHKAGNCVKDEAWQPLAECYRNIIEADSDAQTAFKLALLYYYRRKCFSQNYEWAEEWFEKAADWGHAGAMVYLAFIYEKGRGVEPNKETANQWRKNLEYRIVKCADEQERIRLLESRAYAYQQFAKIEEEPAAMCELGILYENGLGVKQDRKIARRWLAKSRAMGNAKAEAELERMKKSNGDVENNA